MMRRLIAVAALLALAGSGCGDDRPAGTPASGAASPAAASPAAAGDKPTEAAAFNDTDVMFAQMSVEHIRQGQQVVALAAQRASDPQVTSLVTELREQWRGEAETMMGWLVQWQKPLTADPDAGAHAGHGDLHSLRDADIAELSAAQGETFDRTALSLLLGHLHNCVETARMETAAGRYPAAINLAGATISKRQAQVQRMLTLMA
jgi:uncharacterized protein (DUF305 family)